MALPSTEETGPEKKPTVDAKNELNKPQRKFASRAIKTMAKAFGVSRQDFEIVRLPDDSDSPGETGQASEPKEGEHGYDGEAWQEATPAIVARYAIRYTGDMDLLEREIMVGASRKKGRVGWATTVYATTPDGEKADIVPTVDIPIDV